MKKLSLALALFGVVLAETTGSAQLPFSDENTIFLKETFISYGLRKIAKLDASIQKSANPNQGTTTTTSFAGDIGFNFGARYLVKERVATDALVSLATNGVGLELGAKYKINDFIGLFGRARGSYVPRTETSRWLFSYSGETAFGGGRMGIEIGNNSSFVSIGYAIDYIYTTNQKHIVSTESNTHTNKQEIITESGFSNYIFVKYTWI
ncbi:MAG: hypothetical protein E7K04_01170 [Helicobacter sp.]|mgnify:CR=1 FL=1|nr:hypothetical protein [Helicobacter sp.]